MFNDIKLDTDDDLLIENGLLFLHDKEDELTKQKVAVVLRTYRGEWFVDFSVGVPYFQEILVGKGNKDLADVIIRSAIQETEGVQDLISFSSTLNNLGEYRVSFKATTTNGDIVSFSNQQLA